MNRVDKVDFDILAGYDTQSEKFHQKASEIINNLEGLIISTVQDSYKNTFQTEFEDALQEARLAIFEILCRIDPDDYSIAQIISYIKNEIRSRIFKIEHENKVRNVSHSRTFGEAIYWLSKKWVEHQKEGKEIDLEKLHKEFTRSMGRESHWTFRQFHLAWMYMKQGCDGERYITTNIDTDDKESYGLRSGLPDESDRSRPDAQFDEKEEQKTNKQLADILDQLMHEHLSDTKEETLKRFVGWGDYKEMGQDELAEFYGIKRASVYERIRRARNTLLPLCEERGLSDLLYK